MTAMKILMATDGSVQASTAMLSAARLLGAKGIQVDVISVGPEVTATPGIDARVHGKYEKQIASQTQKTLKDAQSILAQLHVKTHGLLESGSPADKILKVSSGYDLTVLGAYGNHERKQPGLGPVASCVLQQGSGNLVIGRELANENNFRILLAVDSSDASLKALEAIPYLFDPASIEVTVMHVVETSWVTSSSAPSQEEEIDVSDLGEFQQQLARELRRTANAVVELALRRLEHWSIPASSIIREGDPALELCREAEQGGYDLVLAGATGTSDIKHAVLGSVSLKLAWDSPTSVGIIRQRIA